MSPSDPFPAVAEGVLICRSPNAGNGFYPSPPPHSSFQSRNQPGKGNYHLPTQRSMTDFLAALGLMFVIEGLVLAAFPQAARRAVATMAQAPDAALRAVGILSAVIGLGVVWLVRW
jgi:uncharacterized protein YjeT (DUF2065 family)